MRNAYWTLDKFALHKAQWLQLSPVYGHQNEREAGIKWQFGWQALSAQTPSYSVHFFE